MSAFTDALTAADAVQLATFGESVTYTPATGSPVTLTGIWDTSDAVRGAGQDRISGRLWVLVADLGLTPAKNDTFTVSAVVYRIVNVPSDDYDGAGGVFLAGRRRA
jgi:hypothetical protein